MKNELLSSVMHDYTNLHEKRQREQMKKLGKLGQNKPLGTPLISYLLVKTVIVYVLLSSAIYWAIMDLLY